MPRSDADTLIELRALSKYYREGEREHAVLRGLNVMVGRGEVLVLLGRSGSGKSTLLNLISGIDTPSHGEVVIDGVALTSLTERARTLFRRRHIGFVFQFFNLIPTLTVEENLLLPLELNGRTGSGARQEASALLRAVGLADRAASFPDRLSGGEQQRVAIGRAIIHRPSLLLADEPTGNLDADTGQQILVLLERLVREAGMTLLMVTHSDEARALADRVATLRDGHWAEQAKGLAPA
jgi:putative ABC transport system ATP-binding protein